MVSKVISRVVIGVTPLKVLITLLITYLLSPLPLKVDLEEKVRRCRLPRLSSSSQNRAAPGGLGGQQGDPPSPHYRVP